MSHTGLIQRLRNGEEPAFRELVLSFSSRLMTVAKIYTDSAADAEDVLQDAFIVVFQKVTSFRGDNDLAFFGWMKRITINLAISKNRKTYKRVEQSLQASGIDHPFDEQLIAKLSKDEIMNLVYNLPSGYRQVFALFVLEGYSHKEIAEQLGITSSTSRSQLVRAKKLLQTQINHLFKMAI